MGRGDFNMLTASPNGYGADQKYREQTHEYHFFHSFTLHGFGFGFLKKDRYNCVRLKSQAVKQAPSLEY